MNVCPSLTPSNPSPVGIGYAYGGSGIGLGIKRRNFVAGGFFGNSYLAAGPFGYAPFGAAENRVTITIINPPNVVVPSRLRGIGGRDDDDLSGIDLDLVPPKKAAPGRTAPTAHDLPAAPKKAKAPEKPPPEPPKKILPPPPPGPKEPGPLPPPKQNPAEEYLRLLDIGQDAFHRQLYGFAAQRFRQALQI